MNKIEVAKGIYYVGCQDWNNRDFHGYATPHGVTYNSYLIVDEKICLVDLVKSPFADELLDRVSAIVPLDKIDYIVMNHVENDHASGLTQIIPKLNNPEILISGAGAREAEKLYGKFNYKVVKEGDSVSLGENTIKFIPLPMLHWPDSMATYLPEQEILFSNDAFGQHYCSSEPFDDKNNLNDILFEAEKYYGNILTMYSKLVGPALKKTSEIPIKMICPSHGVIWRSHIDKIIGKYQDWGSGKVQDKILVVYDTMWGATECMARAVLEGVTSVSDVKGVLYRLSVSENSQIAADLQESAGIILGSPTLNLGMLPRMGGFLTYLKGLKPTGKVTSTFGTFGWSGGAQADMEEILQKTGMETLPGLTVRWAPDGNELEDCKQFGRKIALAACKKG